MTVLRGVTWEHARGHGCMVAAAHEYRARHPEVRIEWDVRSLQAFADVPLEDLAAEYDLLVIDHPHVPIGAEQGLLAPLDASGTAEALDRLAAQSVGASHASYAHDGHQWALASDAAAQVSASRPDLIAEPPTTWDGVLELARDGRVLWPGKPIDALSSLISIAGAHGAVPATTPGSFLAADDFARAFAVLRALAAAVPPEDLRSNPIEIAERLAVSDYACYSPLLFGYTNYARAGYRPHRLRYRDAPDGPAGHRGALLGGAGIAVSATSRQQDAARDFAWWIAGEGAQRGVYFDGGGQPGNAAAWDDDRLNDLTDDFFRGTRSTLEQAYLRPRTAGFVAFQDQCAPLVTAALQGRLDEERLFELLEQGASRLLNPATV